MSNQPVLTYSICMEETKKVYMKRCQENKRLAGVIHKRVGETIKIICDYSGQTDLDEITCEEGKTALDICKHIKKLIKRSHSAHDSKRWMECLKKVGGALSACKKYKDAVAVFKSSAKTSSPSIHPLKVLGEEKDTSINNLLEHAQHIDGAASTKDRILGGLMITLAAVLLTLGTLALLASIPAIALGPLAFIGCPMLLMAGVGSGMLGSIFFVNACSLFFSSRQHGLSKGVDNLAHTLLEKTNLALSGSI